MSTPETSGPCGTFGTSDIADDFASEAFSNAMHKETIRLSTVLSELLLFYVPAVCVYIHNTTLDKCVSRAVRSDARNDADLTLLPALQTYHCNELVSGWSCVWSEMSDEVSTYFPYSEADGTT